MYPRFVDPWGYQPKYHNIQTKPTQNSNSQSTTHKSQSAIQKTQQGAQNTLQDMMSHPKSTISQLANNPLIKDAGTYLEGWAGGKVSDALPATKTGSKIGQGIGTGIGIADNHSAGIGATVVATYAYGTQEHALADVSNNLAEYEGVKQLAHSISTSISNGINDVKTTVGHAVTNLEKLADPRTWMFR